MKMKKENLMPTIVLGSICLLVAAVLALLNMLTSPVIAEETARRQQLSLTESFPDGEGYDALAFEKLEDVTDLPATVQAIYRETGGRGYAVLLSTTTNYSQGSMDITVAVSPSGEVLGVKLTNYKETKEIGASYPDGFVGKDAQSAADVALVSGATYSSRAFRAALVDALTALQQNGLTGGDAS